MIALILLSLPTSSRASPGIPRIIGGSPMTTTDLDRYPYMASLQWGSHRCGGTFIAADLVLTAAHCIYQSLNEELEMFIDPNWFNPSQILYDTFVPGIHTVQLGKLDLLDNSTILLDDNSSHVETLIVETSFLHPYFNLIKQAQEDEPPHPDIAILKLYGSTKFVEKYATLDNPQRANDWSQHSQQLPEQQPQTEVQLTVMGYGLDETNQTSNILEQTTLRYVPDEACRAIGFWDLLHEDMMCATGDGERDSCNGDSGGPLFWNRGVEEVEDDLQIGIVSWGVACADLKYPGVYTKVSSHYGWIRTEICKLSRFPPSVYHCPPRLAASTNTLPTSKTDLIIMFQMPYFVEEYGLLVESMDDHESAPLLDLPTGSFVGIDIIDGIQSFSLKVQLGCRYRVVLLNSFGSSGYDGKITVQWGEETLVEEDTKQGDLLVFAIVRSFRIADTEEGMSTVDVADGTLIKEGDSAPVLFDGESLTSVNPPTVSPTLLPQKDSYFGNAEVNWIDEADLITTAPPTSESLFALDEGAVTTYSPTPSVPSVPYIVLSNGVFTIDPAYVSSMGYKSSTITVSVTATSGSFVMITDDVTLAPDKGTALNLNSMGYTLADGGNMFGGPSGEWQAPGDGVYLMTESKIDLMHGVTLKGGNTNAEGETAGDALHATSGSEVTIRGGKYYAGSGMISEYDGSSLHSSDSSLVAVYGGSFFGSWEVINGGVVVVHACNFTLETDSVKAKLIDGSLLDVSLTTDDQSNVTAELYDEQECFSRAPTSYPTILPTKRPASSTTSPTRLSTARPSIAEIPSVIAGLPQRLSQIPTTEDPQGNNALPSSTYIPSPTSSSTIGSSTTSPSGPQSTSVGGTTQEGSSSNLNNPGGSSSIARSFLPTRLSTPTSPIAEIDLLPPNLSQAPIFSTPRPVSGPHSTSEQGLTSAPNVTPITGSTNQEGPLGPTYSGSSSLGSETEPTSPTSSTLRPVSAPQLNPEQGQTLPPNSRPTGGSSNQDDFSLSTSNPGDSSSNFVEENPSSYISLAPVFSTLPPISGSQPTSTQGQTTPSNSKPTLEGTTDPNNPLPVSLPQPTPTQGQTLPPNLRPSIYPNSGNPSSNYDTEYSTSPSLHSQSGHQPSGSIFGPPNGTLPGYFPLFGSSTSPSINNQSDDQPFTSSTYQGDNSSSLITNFEGCVAQDEAMVCFNSETVVLDTSYAEETLDFPDGNITKQVEIHNKSNVYLLTSVKPDTTSNAVEVTGESYISTGSGSHIIAEGRRSNGIVFREASNGDLMEGSKVEGGANGGTAIVVQDESVVTIKGGTYQGGALYHESGLFGLKTIGQSLAVEGGSEVYVYGGSFVGDWFIGDGAKVVVHGCNISLEENFLRGIFLDGTTFAVGVNATGILQFTDECPDMEGGLEDEGGVWSSGKDSNSSLSLKPLQDTNTSMGSLFPQNTSSIDPVNVSINDYSGVLGPITTSNIRMILHLSKEETLDESSFYLDRAFFAMTTSFFVNQFYSEIGKDAYDVKAEIQVMEVQSDAENLSVEVIYEQTMMYRALISSSPDIEDIIHGPFLDKADSLFYTVLIKRNMPGLKGVSHVSVPEVIVEPNKTTKSTEEVPNKTATVLWSFIGFFIFIIIGCSGVGILFWRHLSNSSRKGQAELVDIDAESQEELASKTPATGDQNPELHCETPLPVETRMDSKRQVSFREFRSLSRRMKFGSDESDCIDGNEITNRQSSDLNRISGEKQQLPNDDKESHMTEPCEGPRSITANCENSHERLIVETGIPLALLNEPFNKSESQDEASSQASHSTSNLANTFSSLGDDVLDLEVPPGKLGLKLNFPDSGWPSVQEVEESSAVRGLVEAGDRLVSIDGNDFRSVNLAELTKLTNEHFDHSRRMTVFRGKGPLQS